MSDSCVKVGVRIRPLNAKEQHQNSVLTNYDRESIKFKNQSFTLDYVFGPELDQLQMYQRTAAPMLKSFLEGYNVTIMAYGQTGSGKTHTMGTADTRVGGEADEESMGLLPRFVSDLYENLKDLADHEHVQSKIRVSFLEIYGEDVHDLVTDISGRVERPSLPVRENDQGQVFVQGLHEQDVVSAAEALEVLYKGTHNRTTASTNMNAGSSRSHAVFTITLDQRVVSPDGDEDGREMTSKLTFVDLAGSERLKRTGAEGQRMKEGIQINSGLFNLGQVINGLADDQRLKNGTKIGHIPYRNSKLTHLLKDALGGNSKTLFLACVSPAEINESETYSTLLYARQARNIQNKPIQNMDRTQLQIRRLKCTAKTWMIKALTVMYGGGAASSGRPPLTGSLCASPLPGGMGIGHLSPVGRASTGQYISLGSHTKVGETVCNVSELLQRQDVQDYIMSVEEAISASLDQNIKQTPRKVRLSILTSSPAPARGTNVKLTGRKEIAVAAHDLLPKQLFNDHDSKPVGRSDRRHSILEAMPPSVLMDEVESEKLVARMLEIVSKEKSSMQSNSAIGEDVDATSRIDEKKVDQEIEEKEEILTKLMDTVKGYAALKADYEKLMDEISDLDNERRELETALLKAQTAKPTANGTVPKSAAVENLQERFKKVNEELQKMRADRSRKETAYRNMQRESKQCEELSKELYALKSVKVQLQKKQKEQAQLHLKFKKEQQAKLHQLKKSEVKKQQAMNDLKNELSKKQRVLGHKDRELSRMQSKLKACEEHITQLLRIQTVNRGTSGVRALPTKTPAKSTGHADEAGSRSSFTQSLTAIEFDHYMSSKSVLDNLVSERVERKELAATCELKSNIIRELNDEVQLEQTELQSLKIQLSDLEREHDMLLSTGNTNAAEAVAVDIMHVEQDMQGIQVDIDSVTREIGMHTMDLKEISAKIARLNPNGASKSDSSSWEDLGKNVISGLSASQSQAAVWDLLTEKAEAMARSTELQERLKQSADVTSFQQDSAVHYEKQLQAIQEELRVKLLEAEKKRVNDLWALMKAHSDGEGNAHSSASSSAVKNIADEAVRLRAQELEIALEECLENEEAKEAEVEEQRKLILVLENEIMDLRMQQSNPSGSAEHAISGGYYGDLKVIWDKLGTNTAQRSEILDRIERARTIAKEQVRTEYQEQILSAKEEELRLVGEIEQLRAILGLTGGDEVFSAEARDGPLLGHIHALYMARSRLLEQLEARARQVSDIQNRLMTLLAHMELGPDDYKITSCGLNTIVELPTYPFHDDQIERDDEDREELLEIYINKMTSIGVVYDEELIGSWTENVKLLSVERASNIARCSAAKTEASSTAQLLGFSDPEDLASSIDLGDIADLPAYVIETGFDAVFENHFHPLGSGVLADVLERINLVLKTMDINRRAVMKTLYYVASKWNTVISFNGDDLAIPLGVPDVSPSAEILSGLFSSLASRWSLCHEDMNNFAILTSNITSNLTISTADQTSREALMQEMMLHKCKLLCNGHTEGSCKPSYNDAETLEDNIEDLSAAFAFISAGMTELQEGALFIDEIWIKKSIDSTISLWEQHQVPVAKMMVLQVELNRVQNLDMAVKEVRRLDIQLSKHIKEMEDFELTSKQNRNKVLSGSSKALVEEEKFRKSGKRKYEHIVDKLAIAFGQVQYYMVLAKPDLLTSGVVGLTHTAIAAIKGKGKSTERTELMHLHTTTHGTKRWSGDLVDAELVGQSADVTHPPSVVTIMTQKSHSRQPSGSAPLGSPTVKSASIAKPVVVKNNHAVPGGNVFASCLAVSSKDENTNYQNSSTSNNK